MHIKILFLQSFTERMLFIFRIHIHPSRSDSGQREKKINLTFWNVQDEKGWSGCDH